MEMTSYYVLKNRDIIDIFIGDTSFEDEENEKRHMPYKSGSDICSLSNLFGLDVSYGGGFSRWQYMTDLIDRVIKTGRIKDLLAYLFDKKHFKHLTKEYTATREDIDKNYQKTISLVLEGVNNILYLAEMELSFSNGKIELAVCRNQASHWL